VILVNAGFEEEGLLNLMGWIRKWGELQVQAIRVIQNKIHPWHVSKLLPNIERLHYKIL
jgi:hypothetical protein